MKSLKLKIIAWIMALSVVSVLIAVTFAGRKAGQIAREEALNTMDVQADNCVAAIDGFFEKKELLLDGVISRHAEEAFVDSKNVESFMHEMLSIDDAVQEIYTARANKEMILSTGGELPEGFDPTSRSWYQEAVSKKGIAYTAPYVDTVTGLLVVSASKPYYSNGAVGGVIGLDMNLSALVESIDSLIDTSKGDYAFLVDGAGNIIVHKNSEFEPTDDSSTAINEVLGGGYVKSDTNGVEFKDYDGTKAYAKSAVSKTTGWTVYLVSKASVVNAAASTVQKSLLPIILLAAVICCVFAYIMGNSISKPVLIVSEKIGRTSSLDLRETDEKYTKYLSRKDEIGKMSNGVAALEENLGKMAKDLLDIAGIIKDRSMETKGIVATSKEATRAVTETITEMSSAVDNQAVDAQGGIEELTSFSDQLSDVIESAKSVKEEVQKSVSKSNEGLAQVSELAEKVEYAESMQKKADENVSNLLEKSKLIDNITNSIIAIAGQTNLLALNASIEAARAGEAGRGFAVVADEIRELAEQTQTATGNITNIVNDIQTEITYTRESIDAIGTATGECVAHMETAKTAFSDIKDMTGSVGDSMTELSSTLDDIDKKRAGVVSTFSNISAATEEISASGQEINTRTAQQNGGMDNIENSVDEFMKAIDTLNEIVAKFKL